MTTLPKNSLNFFSPLNNLKDTPSSWENSTVAQLYKNQENPLITDIAALTYKENTSDDTMKNANTLEIAILTTIEDNPNKYNDSLL